MDILARKIGGHLKYRTTKILCYSFVTSVLLISCKKFVQIDSPPTQLVRSTVFANDATATAAQFVIYSQMAAQGFTFNLSLFPGLSADEFTNYSASTDDIQMYINGIVAN